MFLSWILYPLTLVLLSLGVGLLVRRIAGDALQAALIIPVGLAGIVVLSAGFQWFQTTADMAPVALVVVAVAGLATQFRVRPEGLRRTLSAPPLIAAAVPFACIAAPVVLTGHPTFTGYGHIVDIAHLFDIAEFSSDFGRSSVSPADSSLLVVGNKTAAAGYPLGGPATMSATAAVVGGELAWLFQPLLAFVGAATGLALYVLLRGSMRSDALVGVAAGVAAVPTILYSYSLTGGLKELLTIAMLLLAAALVKRRAPVDSSPRELVPLGLALGAAFAALTLTIAPFLAVFLGALFAFDIARVRSIRRVLTGWAPLIALAAIAAIPTLIAASDLWTLARAGGPADRGNLAEPVSHWAATGVWWTEDHRFPLDISGFEGPTYVLGAIVLALALAGFTVAVKRRSFALVSLALGSIALLIYIQLASGPWIEFKSIVLTAPVTLAFAFIGVGWLTQRRAWPLAAALSLVVCGSVLVGNAFVYRGTPVAPYDRLKDLEAIGKRLGGDGRALYPAFEEYAEYFLAREHGVGLVNQISGGVQVRPEAARRKPGLQFAYDVDDLEASFLSTFDLLVLRRSPMRKTPPSDWTLVETTRFHEIWRRDPSRQIALHVPLSGAAALPRKDGCRRLASAVQRLGPDRTRVAYAPKPELGVWVPSADIAPFDWAFETDEYVTMGPGRIDVPVSLPAPGRYRVWLRGSTGREVDVRVDGDDVGDLKWRANYPGQYEQVGFVTVGREADLEVVRGGGSLWPATGNPVPGSRLLGALGPVVFEPENAAPRTFTRSARTGLSVCRSKKPLEWIEAVRASGA